MKKLFGTMAVAAALFAGYSAYNGQNSNELSGIILANVEALANDPGDEIQCPDPYDVKDHQLSFSQKTANCTVDANGNITLFGKTFKVSGVEAGTTISKTYEIADCLKPSPGNCCPGSRIGEIKIP